MWDVRYRPLRFSDVLGQDGAVKVLKARLAKGTAHDTSYIFGGGHGQGKCVRGDTLVPTDRGLVPIAHLMGTSKVSPLDVLVRQEGRVARAAYSYRGGLRDTLRIKTHLGYELEGTPNHRIRVMAPNGCIEWRQLGELKPGDYACIVRDGVWGVGADLSGYAFDRSNFDHSSHDFDPPQALNPQWGELMGFMVGDGYCGSRNSVVIACAEADVQTHILELLQRLGGTSHATPDRRRPGLVSIRCSRKQVRAFLAYAGVDYVGAEAKTIPWSVLASPEPVVCAFLRAYFESDGTISGGALEVLTKSSELARQLQVTLSALGIVTRRVTKEHAKYGTFWRVRVMGSSVARFQEKVGFISERKTRALRDFVLRKHAQGKRVLPNVYDVVPFQAAHVQDFYASLPETQRTRETSHFFRCRRGETSCTTRQVAAIARDFPDSPLSAHFRKIHAAGYLYDPVESVESGCCEVYDLNVPDGESFAANGFMNHNTTLAKILGRALLCQNLTADQEPCNACENCIDTMHDASMALSETDAASRGTIEHVRAIVDSLPFVVQNAKKRIYIFDEVHRMSRDSQDVLLKPLEEKRLVGIFCTTEPEKIRLPIRSRCEEYLIRKITSEHILVRMKWILEQEGVEYEDAAVLTVIDSCKGHVRDVLNKLEMFGQLGPITLDAVRAGLNLSVVSTYYRILLALDDPAKAVGLAEEACERVGPAAVSEGIAEAAMNSYRLAHKMGVDYAEIDRDLAIKVHAVYGDNCTRFAEYFTRSYRVTRLSLLSDIIACRGGAPAAIQSAAAAPIVVQVAASVPVVASSAPVAEVASVAPVSTPEPVAVSPRAVTVAPPPPSTPPPAAVPEKEGVLRSDGVGNLGSSDTAALTKLDKFGVPAQMPRMGAPTTRHAPGTPKDKRDRLLTHEEWRTKFDIRVDLLLPKEQRG